jgi:hypothetical protein
VYVAVGKTPAPRYAAAVGAESSNGERIPKEFRYWQQLHAPSVQRLRWLLKKLFGADPVLPDEVVRAYAHSYYDADPVAEAFVEQVYRQQGQKAGRALLDQALRDGVHACPDAPESLQRLFSEIEQPPEWLDWQQVELGARVFRRFGTHMYSQAGAITLQGYRESSVAKPLAFTGAYTGESAQRRFLETAAFWIDVSEPGALRPGGAGVATALRVRVMHVFVRQRLLDHPGWDLEGWGVPISQGDALLTLMGGSFLPGYLLKTLGYRTSREEILATMHFWRYVGHLMGVQPRWYPQTIEEALGLMFASQVKGVAMAGDDGKHLAQSYLASYAPRTDRALPERLRAALEYRLQLGYVGHFLLPTTRRAFELPAAGLWRLHPVLQFPAIFARESLRLRSTAIDDWLDRRARRQTKRWLKTRLGDRAAEYRAVQDFTR